MSIPIVLASGSEIRARLLRQAGLDPEIRPARVDEAAIKDALASEGASPRDTADTLAEFKARRIGDARPEALVIGCDQVLAVDGVVLSKPDSREDAADQLRLLSGKTHMLLSAVVIFEDQRPVWRHVGQVRLTMRTLSDPFIESYLVRNWPSVGTSVGGYKLEEEGVRLFSRIDGDYFTVLGMPMLELLTYLAVRGLIDT
jgi:septum formation protein